MSDKGSKCSSKSQIIINELKKLQCAMVKASFTPGTQKIYLRAFKKFAERLDRKTPATATLTEARRHLTELKQSGVSQTVLGSTSAVLRFYFEDVRGVEWKPISALQKRMVEDMCLHRFSSKTQDSYVRSVSGLAKYYMRSPDLISEEEIRRYFVYLICERKLARATVNIALCGIKFFYEKTLRYDWTLTGVPMPKRSKSLPVILSRKEVLDILSRIKIVRHSACLQLIYACGLRISEACRVKVTDIDRDRKLLHVCGKGSKDRYIPLPDSIMPLLEECWRSHCNKVWLFPWVGRGGSGRLGRMSDRPVPIGSIQQVFRKVYLESGITKKVHVHSLRHAYATHLLEAGISLRQIQVWLGHSSPSMTMHYAQLTSQSTEAASEILATLMNDIGNISER
ncbi:MAG: tyrosine-type recombinase/integrase [Kiritimatiellae bacterium]|nr:tyrosine-type recombinase/integrase [Kiritimatiellia bacterium]